MRGAVRRNSREDLHFPSCFGKTWPTEDVVRVFYVHTHTCTHGHTHVHLGLGSESLSHARYILLSQRLDFEFPKCCFFCLEYVYLPLCLALSSSTPLSSSNFLWKTFSDSRPPPHALPYNAPPEHPMFSLSCHFP